MLNENKQNPTYIKKPQRLFATTIKNICIYKIRKIKNVSFPFHMAEREKKNWQTIIWKVNYFWNETSTTTTATTMPSQPTNIANMNISAGNTNSRMLSKVHQSLGKISKWNFRLNLKLIISHLIKVYLSIKTKNHIDRRRRTATI